MEVVARAASAPLPSHLGNSPPKVRIDSSVPFVLPSCLDFPAGASPVVGTTLNPCPNVFIYIAFHTQPLVSALYVAVKVSRVVRCLSILSTCDHKRWFASLYFLNSSLVTRASAHPYIS